MRQTPARAVESLYEMHPNRKSPFGPINKTPLGALTRCAQARYLPIRAYTERWEKPMGWSGRPGWQHGLPGARKCFDAAPRGQFDPCRWRYGRPERPFWHLRPGTYIWTGRFQEDRPGRLQPDRHGMRAAGILSFCQRVVRIVLEMHTHLRSHRACLTWSQGCRQTVPTPNFMQGQPWGCAAAAHTKPEPRRLSLFHTGKTRSHLTSELKLYTFIRFQRGG